MPGLMKSKKSTDDKDDKNHIYRRVTVSLAREEHSSFSDEEVMNHPGMVRLMGYLESLPVAERILEFTVQSSEEERQNQSGFRVHETEEARRMREIEEDRKNYMNRFFR